MRDGQPEEWGAGGCFPLHFRRKKTTRFFRGSMAHSQSELQVITFATNLCSYVMTITQKSPKQFRQISGRIIAANMPRA